MKIGESSSAAEAYRARKGAARASKADPVSLRRARDTAAILGIPEVELTEKVRQAIVALLGELDSLKQELEASRQRITELEVLADFDGLTPLLNRRAFVRELTRMVAYTQRYNAPAAMLYFDLSGFKAINDTFGHAAGDAALIHVANLLQSHVRGSDVIGRLGGDEFGVLLAQADEAAARAKAEALTKAIAETPLNWQGRSIPLAASYGLYVFRPDSDPNQVLDEADRSMYRSRGARNAAP